MNNNFKLIDKVNNIEKIATPTIKFSYDNRDYLIYSVEENEQNRQIFTSKIILNSEGNYFIDDLLPQEKGKISEIVYNIIILTPTEFKKISDNNELIGNDAKTLISNLSSKFSIKISLQLPSLGIQDYCSNSSIAITSKDLVFSAIDFYSKNLEENIQKEESPVWTIPVENTSTIVEKEEIVAVPNENELIQNNSTVTVPETVQNLNSNNQQLDFNNNLVTLVVEPSVTQNEVKQENKKVEPVVLPINHNEENLPNPQQEKLAIISDPNLSNAIGIDPRSIQPNMQKIKRAGFARNKYVILGTICLVLAVAVIIAAYFLIKNIK
ncbi:MAG: hypothetical protein IJZ46_04155 [Bacilli bacterium]|nr:hypothetical protein [Bacilli bacterium]